VAHKMEKSDKKTQDEEYQLENVKKVYYLYFKQEEVINWWVFSFNYKPLQFIRPKKINLD